jgi:hypothetical protein
MKTISAFLLPILLLLPSLALASTSSDLIPHYRVEVIVFVHSGGQFDRRLTGELDDYSPLLDPLKLARQAALGVGPDEPDELEATAPHDELDEARQAIALIEALSALEEAPEAEPHPALAGPVYPDTYINQSELSGTMQRAWQRLADSPEFNAVTWRAWYQPLSRGRLEPAVRLHDERIVRMDWLALTPLGPSRRTTDQQEESDPVSPLTTNADYRLDGSLRLRQRQFMHVELDLVWRELAESGFGPMSSEYLPPAGFYQHRLVQSRTVRPGRLEYFDSTWLGVLVLIEPWEAPDEPDDERPNSDLES